MRSAEQRGARRANRNVARTLDRPRRGGGLGYGDRVGRSDGSGCGAGVPIEGVSLEQYAFVVEGLAVGIALRELLDDQRIDPRLWSGAQAGWSERVLDDLARDDELEPSADLALALEALRASVRERFVRPLPPLDEDLRAWLDFQRGVMLRSDAARRLAEIPMSAADLGRLQRLWAERMAEDPSLVQDVVQVMAEPPWPVDVPPPPTPWIKGRTPRRKRHLDATAPVCLDMPDASPGSTPFVDGPVIALPRVLAAMPAPPAAPEEPVRLASVLNRTAPMEVPPDERCLPFAPGADAEVPS